MSSTPVKIKKVPGCPGYYVGDDGTVWSCLTQVGRKGRKSKRLIGEGWKRLRSINRNGFGHQAVTICRNCKGTLKSVHRLVLEAFVGPCPPGLQCRHLDGDPTNNCLENLRWGTPKENGEDKARHGTGKGERNAAVKLTIQKVKLIKARIGAKHKYKDIGRDFGVCLATIAHIATGRNWGWVQ